MTSLSISSLLNLSSLLFATLLCSTVQARVVSFDFDQRSLTEELLTSADQPTLSGADLSATRPTAIPIDDDNSLILLAEGEALQWLVLNRKQPAEGGWKPQPYPANLSPASNIVSQRLNANSSALFFQGTDGQIYGTTVTHPGVIPKFADWVKVGNYLIQDKDVSLHGKDSIIVFLHEDKIKVFARSMCNDSRLFLTSYGKDEKWTDWQLIGGTKATLMTDAAIAYNSFTTLLEAFMVSTDGYLYRSWQVKGTKWAAWDKTGYYAPKSTHRPVVHSMDTNLFNGRLNVFVHGTDKQIHHIWQTTCDGVPNPWGWCTWSYWYSIGSEMPETPEVANTLSVANNIHLGIELFTQSKDGKIWKMWQSTRHDNWENWELVSGNTDYHISSLPHVMNDATGWLAAYAVDTAFKAMVITQRKMMRLTDATVTSGGTVQVSWDIPVDEARHTDWIAVYPAGTADNHNYVDFYYVGGTQNPLKEAVPKGGITFTTYLGKGTYDVRYLADRRFVDAIGTTLTVDAGTPEETWVQIFEGVFTGLNLKNVSVKTCVKDAEDIEHDFLASFEAFEDRKIVEGIVLMGKALQEVLKASHDCGIDSLVKQRIEVFINDLVSCAKSPQTGCIHFLIDIGSEVLVLYENIYEIYGDVIAANNAFDVKAYHQGGFNVGRVVGACLALPR